MFFLASLVLVVSCSFLPFYASQADSIMLAVVFHYLHLILICLWETGSCNGVHCVHKERTAFCSIMIAMTLKLSRMSEGVESIYSLACHMGVLFNHVTLVVIQPDSLLF